MIVLYILLLLCVLYILALRAEAGPQRVISSALQRKHIEHSDKQ